MIVKALFAWPCTGFWREADGVFNGMVAVTYGGLKAVARCSKADAFDPVLGMAIAIVKLSPRLGEEDGSLLSAWHYAHFEADRAFDCIHSPEATPARGDYMQLELPRSAAWQAQYYNGVYRILKSKRYSPLSDAALALGRDLLNSLKGKPMPYKTIAPRDFNVELWESAGLAPITP